jgi:hypothetical protein
VSVPVTLCTYARATTAAGRPWDISIFSACSVSMTHGGLTALTRILRGAYSAAALTNRSRPAFTRPTSYASCRLSALLRCSESLRGRR